MAKSNNMLLVLAIALLIVSLFGTVAILNSVGMANVPVTKPSTIQQGQVKLEIVPDAGADAATGYVTLNILPE
jgi:hypothetical protein